MNNTIKIDGTNDDIWAYPGAKEGFLVELLCNIKYELQLSQSCLITLPIYNVSNNTDSVVKRLKILIYDFDDNFTTTILANTILLTRIDKRETYMVHEFKD